MLRQSMFPAEGLCRVEAQASKAVMTYRRWDLSASEVGRRMRHACSRSVRVLQIMG